MRLMPVILICLVLTFPGLLWAKMYKYYDQNGALCFTDNFSQVPEAQRPKVETLPEVQSQPDDSQEIEKEAESIVSDVNENKLKLELEQELRNLESVKKELDEEYLLLKELRDQLVLESQRKMNSQETKAYNQRANALNQETLKYKEKKDTYLQRVEAYNLKLASVQ